MALVKYGGGIVQMSGSIAGNVHARNRFGNYMRARTKPINPNTTGQQQVRAAMAYLTEWWAETLTIPERTAWNLYANSVNMKNKLGEVIKLSGFNQFIRSNAWLARAGLTIIEAGPTTFSLPDKDPTLSITASAATQIITIAYDDTLEWDNETGGHLIYGQGSPQNGQRNFFGGPWKNLGNIDGVTGVPVPSPALSACVFAIAAGQRQWVQARILRADGRLSEPFEANCIVGA